MKFLHFFMTLVFVSLIFSCGTQQAEGDRDDQPSATMGAGQTGIPVEALVLKENFLEQNMPFTGVLKPIHSVDLIAEISGKIQRIHKNLGDRVTRRDTLAIIDDRIALSQYRQAKSQVLSAETNLKIAQVNLKSDAELLKNGDISQLSYENSLLAVNTAKAQLLSAQANLDLTEKNYFDTRIVSPINGRISRKYIDLCAIVTPTMPTYRVVDITTLKVEVGLPQAVINSVHVGSQARLIIAAISNQEFNGSVRYISPQADENTGTFATEIHVKNSPDLKIQAGMTTRIELSLTTAEKRLIIPDYALVSRNNQQFVYKIQQNTASLSPVSISKTFGSQVLVEEGLAEGDTIVVVGMKNLGVDSRIWIESLHH
jgi:RND family efflux transporter MFP subunit